MSSPDEDTLSTTPRLDSTAIPIPDADFYDESDDLLSTTPTQSGHWASASPGAGSYVTGEESWRPVPPPMLASSLDRRFRPSLQARTSQQPHQHSAPTQTRTSHMEVADDTLTYGSIDDGRVENGEGDGVSAAILLMRRRQRNGTALPPRVNEDDRVTTRSTSIRAKLTRLAVQIRQINEAPRELWLIFSLKFLSSFAYFSFSLILTIFLTDEFGFSDTAAGWSYGIYGVMSTFFGFLCGWFIDYMGVRASLLVGSLIGAVSRLVLALTMSRHTAMIVLYTFLPFAECLGIPIMTIGIKRYTNARNRTFAFSLFYSVMNMAALCAGPLVDFCRGMFGNGVNVYIAPLNHGFQLSALRLVILTSSVATAAMCIVVLIGIREIEVDEFGNLAEFIPNRDSPLEQTMAVLRESAFWRLTVFTLLLVGVRLVFRHLDATLPKYLVRQFGPTAPFGMVYAINPFLIIFLVPVVGLLTRKVDSFSMIVGGSFVSAASPLWLAIDQSYLAVVLFMVTLSLGEAVYSPRVYEYTMEVSANGAEGLYSSLSTAPLFSVKLLVGGMSGWLLTRFMPVDGPHHGRVLWGIIGACSMTSPILMWMLRNYISPPSDNPADNNSTSSNLEPTSRKLVKGAVPVSGARPPKGQTNSILIQPKDNDDGNQANDEHEKDVAFSSSYLGKSPLSLPPICSDQLPTLHTQLSKPSTMGNDS